MPHSNATNGLPREGYLNLTRRMENEEDDQFDVDLTILDFLVYKAIGLVFEWRSSSDPYHSDLPNALVNMTADWRTFLGHRHQGRRLDAKASFRSRLLQFSLIFTHRLHHGETWTTEESLNILREQNKNRGDYWEHRTQHPPALSQPFDQQKDFPLSDGALYENRSELASALGMPLDQRRWVTDVAGTPSLHCLLPVFIELTAARVNLDDDWVPSSEWFNLAGQFMLQAVIGEYLRNGAYGEETFNTIFAYGCPGVERWAEEPADVAAMRRLFCDEGNLRQENRAWTNVKRQYINELLPQSRSQTSLQALEAAQRRYPYAAFEEQLLSFLKYLHDGLVKPDLAQVEEGRINIDGTELSEADSRAMIQRMGL
ncbi:hypothetical protein PTT_12471 [Pyrenophora teres f. teres 0-1]|uniref:Uncharacterized protein n=1 Tax=Pyrenophora teres f. teres (strain 0-1) TaxID=861557 RepID=E3RTV9_PYRTT|nr:hypothetical protein PTT_12471 [Pyrenophora teres f. teres 0-1]KAE8838962.1 hypothetical protein HRS9139_03345 [Pyrenophora teres f. teres]KAE8844927.1 hypothetical protein PTNB85_03192 [Pyrenophora teres f. teres]KAE8846870.1 hypothetical protein HRS9122_03777 [Pyrenophora teres f. teres]CAA9962117.1 hypothetical protein PTMSG1_05494 [Pyrenophora teres f. maculata]